MPVPNKAWIGWGLTIAGIVAAGPFVLGRGNPSLSHSRDTISRMSEVERTSLKRKYQEYRSLTEPQRAELRKLHQQLEEDRVKGPRYLDAMTLYCDWLKTIDAWQQDELAHLDQPAEKAQRVASIVQERAAEGEGPGNDQPPGSGLSPLARLNESQLTKVFDFLAKGVTLTEEEQQKLDALHGLKRFGSQLRLLREKGGLNPEKVLRTLSNSDFLQLVEASGSADLKTYYSGPGDVDMRRKRVVRMIFASCLAQLARETSAITDDQLRAHLGTLPPEQQDELLQLQADQFKFALQRSYLLSDLDVAELRAPLEREVGLGRRRNSGGPAGNRPTGEGMGPRAEGEGGRFKGSFFNRPLGRNRPSGPENREPPPDGPPPDGPPPGGPPPDFDPNGEPPPPRP